MHGMLLRIWLINLASWAGWWTFLMYHTDWVGRAVFLGSPDGTAVEQLLYEQVRTRRLD